MPVNLEERLQACMEQAIGQQEAAGLSLLVWQNGKELCCLQAGMADREAGLPVRRDSIFRLYSQSKPVTAAAAMLLVERGVIDLMDGVERYLPGFRHPRAFAEDGTVRDLPRAPWISELLSMTSGLCYPDADPAGQAAARVFEAQEAAQAAGAGMDTVTFCNRLGEQPLAFAPGSHWRYGTSADVLAAVVEVASGKRFGDFLREELLEPLGMRDTAFWVPAEKRERFVTAYSRGEEGLKPYEVRHLAVGRYDAPPAFESGGAGLVSTLDDYMAFAQMLMAGGVYRGRRILSEATVRHMTSPQLPAHLQRDMWDNLGGYSYGHLMRMCDAPGAACHLAERGEYGWDGWLGTYFINLPASGISFLMFQNTKDAGTTAVVRKCRNILAARPGAV